MEKLTIAIGTTSDQKIKYLREVLKESKIKAHLIPVQTESRVSDQPKTTEETKQGSINRAKSAFGKIKEANFAIGIEVGYHKDKNSLYEMFC